MYYYTDHEELLALRKQVQELLKENNTLKELLAKAMKECGKLNRQKLNEGKNGR